MIKYKLRYTTPQGVQFLQDFNNEEDRNNAFQLIGSTKRIYGKGNLVLISDNIICIEAVNVEEEEEKDSKED